MAWSEIWEQPLATPHLSALIPGLPLARLDLFVLVPASSFHQSSSAPSLDLLSLQGTWRDQLNLSSVFWKKGGLLNPARLQLLPKEQAPRCLAGSQPEVTSRGGMPTKPAKTGPKVALLAHTSHRCQEHRRNWTLPGGATCLWDQPWCGNQHRGKTQLVTQQGNRHHHAGKT